MLVLTRRLGEEIVVPQLGIVLTVLEIHGSRVRLGISAPPEVGVYRHEVWLRIQQDGGGEPVLAGDAPGPAPRLRRGNAAPGG